MAINQIIIKQIVSRQASLIVVAIFFLGLLVTLGCWSGEEKVIKPLNLVAQQHDGHYTVESFLIDGEPPEDRMTRLPGEEVKFSLTFTRHQRPESSEEGQKVETPFGQPSNPYPLSGYILLETKENNMYATGSQTQVQKVSIPNQPGPTTQSVDFSLTMLDSSLADFAQQHCLGRYCKIVVAEGGSKVVSQKIYIAKE